MTGTSVRQTHEARAMSRPEGEILADPTRPLT